MSFQYKPGSLERLIGIFYRVNTRTPPPTPTGSVTIPIQNIVISKGILRIKTPDGEMKVDIPQQELVDDNTYINLVDLLSIEFVKFIGIPEYTNEIKNAMRKNGITVNFSNGLATINPLKLTGVEDTW